MRREGYEVVTDWREITSRTLREIIGFVFLLKEVAFLVGEGDEGDDVSVLQTYIRSSH